MYNERLEARSQKPEDNAQILAPGFWLTPAFFGDAL
jgi:hypothetical protein